MSAFPENDEHIIEAIGKCRVIIRKGVVVEVGQPEISCCPLAKRFAYPVPDITPDAVKANVERRIKKFGMCTPEREVLDHREFVGFGASEIFSFGITSGHLDAVVIACDGAGTVIATDPAMIQGIGGRMSGLIATTPIPEVIKRITANGGIVIDPDHARMDPVAGVKRAYSEGYRTVAVTVASAAAAADIRNRFPDVLICTVHTTGLSREEAESLAATSDLITACASGPVREIAGAKALLQAGVSVPIFAMTKKGKNLILDKLRESPEPVLVKPTRLPSLVGEQPEPLI